MTKHDEMAKDPKGQPASDVETRSETTGFSNEDTTSGKAQKMMSNAVSATEHVGSGIVGSVATVATDLVHGVGDLGEEVISVVRDTANTAIVGVGSVGETAVHTLADLFTELVSGVKEIGSAAMRGRSITPEADSSEARAEQIRQQRGRSKETGREEAIH